MEVPPPLPTAAEEERRSAATGPGVPRILSGVLSGALTGLFAVGKRARTCVPHSVDGITLCCFLLLRFGLRALVFFLTRICFACGSWRLDGGVHRRIGRQSFRQRCPPGSRAGGLCGGGALHRGSRGFARLLEGGPIEPADHVLHGP